MMTGKIASTIALLTAGCASALAEAQPVDSLRTDSLQEVVVVAVGNVRAISLKSDGTTVLSRKGLSESPSFMGSNDPVAMLRTLPAIATNNDLQASLNVKGTPSGANSYTADNVRITNPFHLLGFYSAFNPDFFSDYSLRSGFIPASAPNTSGAWLTARTDDKTATKFNGALSAGLIESHFAMEFPIVAEKASLAIGARAAYPSLIFPDMLKMGSSSLEYGFWDSNLCLTSRLPEGDLLKITAFADRDNTNVTNRRQGAKDGFFRWHNVAAGCTWIHNGYEFSAHWSQYRNRLYLDQAGRILDLPSGLDQTTVMMTRPFGEDWQIESDINWRRTSGQHNSALHSCNGIPSTEGFEVNAAVDRHLDFHNKVRLDGGLRLSFYASGGYASFYPQPRLMATWRFADDLFLSAAYQRQVRFDRLIEASSGGLPSDFWTMASEKIKPDDVHSLEIGCGGRIPAIGATFRIDLYAKLLLHATDYTGSVMDMLSPSYDGMANIADARGWSHGISLSLMRQFGRVRGRISYNLGKTELQSDRTGDRSFPASYDRTHDLNVSVTWQPFTRLYLSASYVYATGLPYTKAKYGYMIGENLICEYYPRNSSRLPDYKRMDMSASWIFTNSHGIRHQITLSVYNMLGNRNVLFRYPDYSVSNGVSHKSSVMDMVIPSITYSISLR